MPRTRTRSSISVKGPLRARSATSSAAIRRVRPGTAARSSTPAALTSTRSPSRTRSRPVSSRRGPSSAAQPIQVRAPAPRPSGEQSRMGAGLDARWRTAAGTSVERHSRKRARRRAMPHQQRTGHRSARSGILADAKEHTPLAAWRLRASLLSIGSREGSHALLFRPFGATSSLASLYSAASARAWQTAWRKLSETPAVPK